MSLNSKLKTNYSNLIFSLFLLLPLTTQNKATRHPINTDYIKISANSDTNLCDQIVIRTYYLARLSRMTQLLEKIGRYKKTLIRNVSSSVFIHCTEEPEKSLFTHPKIKKCINDIEAEHSLLPLIKIWNNLKHYQSIEDLSLVEEYAKLSIIIVKEIIISSLSIKKTPLSAPFIDKVQETYKQSISMPLYKLSEFIDYFVDLCETKNNNIIFLTQKNLGQRFHPDIQSQPAPTAIIKRFYYIQRLSKAFDRLSPLRNKKLAKITLRPKHTKKICLIDESLNLNNQIISECASGIKTSKEIEPLFRLWDNIQNYKLVDDDEFIKEFVIIVIALCKNIMLNMSSNEQIELDSLDDILEMYDQISNLPIIKLLDTLDLFAEKLSDIMTEYDIEGGIIVQWHKWLFQQWWLPPLIIMSIAITLSQQK